MGDRPPKQLTTEEIEDLRSEARRHSTWAREELRKPEEDATSLELSPEDLEVLKAHHREMKADIEAGRFRPGERRCVTLPGGSRFYLAHPDPSEEAPKPQPWWVRLFSRG